MWTTFKAVLSHVALDCFNSEIALLLRSLTILVLPCRTNSDNVLHPPQLPLQILEWKRSLKLEAIREKRSTSSNDEPRQRAGDAGALSKPFSHKEVYQLVRHRADDITTHLSADKAARETTVNEVVSPLTSSSDLGASSRLLSTGPTDSSSRKKQTKAPSNYVRDVDGTTFVVPTTPTSPVAEPPSPPAITDAASGQSGTTTSITPVLTTSPSQDRPLPPSTTQPGSPAQSPASSVASSFTEHEATVTSVGSSTESSTTSALSATRDTSSTRTTTTTTSTSTSLPAVSSCISAGGPTSTATPSSTTVKTTSEVSSSPGSVSLTSPGSTSVPISTTSISSTLATETSSSPPPTSPVSISSTVSSNVSTTASVPSSSRCSSSTSTWTTSKRIMTTTYLPWSSSNTLTSATSLQTTSAWISRSTSSSSRQPVSKPPSPSSSSSTSRPDSSTSASSSFTRNTSMPTVSWDNRMPYSTLTLTSSSIVSTRTTTVVAYTTHHSNRTITTVATGTLRTSAPLLSAFARNTGGIIGVAIASFIALLCLLFCLFFLCRRYRRRQNHHYDRSNEGIVALVRSASRRPVDGDDDSYLDKENARFAPPSTTQGHSADGMQDPLVDGTTSHGEHLSSGHGSAESANATMVPMSMAFGGQPYLPGLDSDLSGGAMAAMPPVFLPDAPTRSSHDAWRAPAGSYPYVNTGGSRSAVSLTVAGGSSREDIYSSSSTTEESARRYFPKRKSSSGPRPMTYKSERHKSTPPTAFALMGVHDQPSFDFERQVQVPEQHERSSVKSFISRLRNGRQISTQSLATVQGPTSTSHGRESNESFMPPITVFSPSLLNPPVIVTPPRPTLTFPRGITGNSYTPLGSQRSKNSSGDGDSSTVPWPPATLPIVTPPSPSPTDNSSGMMVEGLLHPRLALQLAQSQQASMTSLRDHEDYSRPINGLVNNHLRSTTTFETHDSNEPERA